MNPLTKKYGKLAVWVNWKLEERKGKKTKIPLSLNGRMASSTDPKTWATHEKVLAKSKNVGIVFTPEKTFLGIDVDHCLVNGKLVHPQAEAIAFLIENADTYTEVSPSGTGLHIYLALSKPLKLTANRHEGFEAYTEGRYFTVTGKSFGDVKPVRTIDPEEAIELLKLIGYPWKKKTQTFDDKDIVQDEPRKRPSILDQTTLKLRDDEVLGKMFSGKNTKKIQQVYDADASEYGDDFSRADMALLAHLAFWTQKDAAQMERLWLASPIGARKKTVTRGDYRTRSINAAIANCSEIYTPLSPGESEIAIDDKSLDLLYFMKDKHKVFYKNLENMTRLLSRHPEFVGTLRFDAYHEIIERKVNGTWRHLLDHDVLDYQARISVLFSDFANIGKDVVYDAMMTVTRTNEIDSGLDYIKALKWDGEARLDSWISKAYGTADDEYHQKVGANWLKGMVKRIVQPGCKFDYVLVLEGDQGIKKSTSLLMLAGELGHVETTMSTEQKDFFMQFLGNAIVEFSEGETLSRTEVKRMKALITVQVDKYRAPYGRTVLPHPRRSVFAMTTNQTEYLKDETGNRRWLPVAVKGHANLEWIKDNREQLLAEAYHRVVEKHETTWEFPEKEMLEQQNMRRIQGANADPIVNWYATLTPTLRDEGVTTEMAHRNGLNSGFMSPMTKPLEMEIADVFKTVLMLEKKRGMIGGIRATRWYPTPESLEAIKGIEVPSSAPIQHSLKDF